MFFTTIKTTEGGKNSVNGLFVMLFSKKEASYSHSLFCFMRITITRISFFPTKFVAEIFTVFNFGGGERTGTISYTVFICSFPNRQNFIKAHVLNLRRTMVKIECFDVSRLNVFEPLPDATHSARCFYIFRHLIVMKTI